MAEVKWIKLTTSMFDDEKIDFIDSLPEADAILVIWIRLLTMAGKCNAGGYIFLTENIPYTEEMLSHKFRRPLNVIKLALQTFFNLGMVENSEKGIYIINWEKHQNVDGLDKIREQTRQRVAAHRERLKLAECNVTSNVTVTQSNATDIDKELDIDKDKEKIKKRKIYYAESVSMTESEHAKLVQEFGEQKTVEIIERLSLYKLSKGVKYKSDYHTILAWDRKDKKQQPKQKNKDWESVFDDE